MFITYYVTVPFVQLANFLALLTIMEKNADTKWALNVINGPLRTKILLHTSVIDEDDLDDLVRTYDFEIEKVPDEKVAGVISEHFGDTK